MTKTIEPYKGISNAYDEIRPSYPEKLIKDLIIKTNINKDAKILEIGAGTGKATVQLAEEGFNIHAIEIGEDMGKIFREKCSVYPRVSLDIAAFEVWENNGGETYDMIYSAQAFHWLDIDIKYKKCYNLLKDDGYLALFWYNTYETTSELEKKMKENVNTIIQKYCTNYSIQEKGPQRKQHTGVCNEDERIKEIESSGLFRIIEKLEYNSQINNNAMQYIKAMKSVPSNASLFDRLDKSAIQAMDREIEEVVNSYGGIVPVYFHFSLYITRKKL